MSDEMTIETLMQSNENLSRRASRRRKKRWPAIVGTVLGLFLLPVLVVGGYVTWLSAQFEGNVTHLDEAFPSNTDRPVAVTGVTNVLLLGSDTRDSLGEVSDGSPTGQRADTMIFVHVPADRNDIVFLSLMRDLWVEIPGHGQGKLNAAFSWGGVPLAVATIENLLGSRIDHVAVVDFGGFGDIATALGGVDVYSEHAFESQNMPGFSFQAGLNHVSGDAALAFVRERYAFVASDFQRVRNQQQFMKGAIRGVLNTDVLLNPARTSELISSLSSHLSVDKSMSVGTISQLAFELRGINPNDSLYNTLPTTGTGTSADGQSIVLLDKQKVLALQEALTQDRLADFLRSEAVQAAGSR